MASPPRFLTVEEIKDIIDVLPRVSAVSPDIGEHVRSQIMEKISLQLSDLKVCPDGIPLLKRNIINQFKRAVISPGEPVGVLTGEAIGGPTTQISLDTFHNAGSASSATMGIRAINELLFAGNRSHKVTTIHFRNKNLTFEQVLEMRKVIEGVTIGQISKGTKIFMSKDSPRSERGWWYNLHDKIFRNKIVESKYYLRIEFDINTLYSRDLTLQQIAECLEFQNSVMAVASPTFAGIIDLYPIKDEIDELVSKRKGKSKDFYRSISSESELNYIQESILPVIKGYIVKGVPHISHLEPVSISVTRIIIGETPIPQIEKGWNLWYSPVKIRTTGITLEKLYNLLEEVDIEIISKPLRGSRKIEVIMPDGWENKCNCDTKTPTRYIHALLDRDEKESTDRYNRLIEEGKSGVIEDTDLSRKGSYVYARTEGFNLRTLLSHPLVDPSRTISNSSREVLLVLGIDATRNFIAKEFDDMISGTRSYINKRYISLIADFMTNIGSLVPITSRGAARQMRGPFSDSTFERSFEIFVNAAAEGEWKDVSSTSAAIYTGNRIKMGTGLPIPVKVRKTMNKIEQKNDNLGLLNMELNFDDVGLPEQKGNRTGIIYPLPPGMSIKVPQIRRDDDVKEESIPEIVQPDQPDDKFVKIYEMVGEKKGMPSIIKLPKDVKLPLIVTILKESEDIRRLRAGLLLNIEDEPEPPSQEKKKINVKIESFIDFLKN